jgi:hypothetical protein
MKTVPTLASLIDDAKSNHPSETYDQQFDRALAAHTSMMGGLH